MLFVASHNIYTTHCLQLNTVTYIANVFTTVLTGISSVLNSAICPLLLKSSHSSKCVELVLDIFYRVTSLDTPWTLL